MTRQGRASKNPYQETLNLPRTSFPMRGRLPRREPEIQQRWAEMDLYKRMLEMRQDAPVFVLHDGPPYSNGHIHLGHALNKILKDVYVKFFHLRGFRAPFVPGWDNHGLPIENAVKKEDPELARLLSRSGEEINDELRLEVRRRCRAFARRWVDVQREEFLRLGVVGDYAHPYLTMDPAYEGEELEIFADLLEQGYIYRERLPVHWCPHCRTALAMAEIEYRDKKSPSLWFLAPAREVPEALQPDLPFFLVVWTTTPWTLLSNRAFAFHPDAEYALVEYRGTRYLLARERLSVLAERLGVELSDLVVHRTIPGREMEHAVFQHPFLDRTSPAVLAEFVGLDEGSGIVHIAPGHGREDFEVGRAYGLEVFSPVDPSGRFTDEAAPFARGLTTDEVNPRVIETLREKGHLLHAGTIIHSYPHCWRCKNPLIFRATWQWFLSVDHQNLRTRALRAIEEVRWYPPESLERIRASVRERPDWVLSRQRIWGVNIPAFSCKKCGEVLLKPEVVRHVARIFREESADAWYARTVEELLPEGTTCASCGGREFRKEHDILDVWFDSGATSLIVLPGRNLPWPSDLYLEGPDQHRGWFNASLMLAMASRKRPPYRAVITNGWTVDETGKAMHKSLGNVVSPQEIVEKYGADVLRLWTISADYTQDMRMGPEIQARLVDAYRKIRNTLRFLLGNLYDFRRDQHALNVEQLRPLDRYMLHRHEHFVREVTRAYESYELHRLFHLFVRYMGVDLSSFYLDVLKDRLYTWAAEDPGRRSAQTVLRIILEDLLILLAPVLSHTAQEAWDACEDLPGESPLLQDWPRPRPAYLSEELARDFEELMMVREQVLLAVEEARKQGMLRDRLEAAVYLSTSDPGLDSVLRAYREELPELLIVSSVELSEREGGIRIQHDRITVDLHRAGGQRCVRCWWWRMDVDDEGVCGKCRKALAKTVPPTG